MTSIGVKPACSSPKERPPQPANKSMKSRCFLMIKYKELPSRADGRPNPFAATRKFHNIMYISYYLHRLVFVSASAVYGAKLRIFFETSTAVDKVNARHGQKLDTPKLRMVVIAINLR